MTERKKDIGFLLLLLVLALLLRLPFLAHPAATMFDEVIYMDYTKMTLAHTPTFDIHPPFIKLMMLGVAKQFSFDLTTEKVIGPQLFKDFPYLPLRTLVAIFGTLLPLIVYLIGRTLRYSPMWAFAVALFVVFDNALILYSRVMLPDMILLTLNFAGLLFALGASREEGKLRYLYVFLSSVLFACAIASKWTALAVIAVALVIFIRKKIWSALPTMLIIIPLVYFGSFALFFAQFPVGGHIAPIFGEEKDPYNVQWITDIEFPRGGSLAEVLPFTANFHRTMLRANTDAEVNAEVFRPEGPIDWPLGKSSILFWHDTAGAVIRLTGNAILWGAAFLLFCYGIISLILRYAYKNQRKRDEDELLLMFGYLINYIPFFFIDRPMYLYHYFAALLFLFLLVPKILPRLNEDLLLLSGRPKLPKLLLVILALFLVLCFIVLLSTTYGFIFFSH